MKDFEFIFDGKPTSDGVHIDAGIRILRGDPLEIANSLGMYAALKLRAGEPQSAIVVINAFKKFMEICPELTNEMLRALSFNEGPTIIRPEIDSMGNINPFKAIKGNKN